MSARERLTAAAKERVLIFDGAFGTQIQARKLTDAQITHFWDAADGGFYGAGADDGLWLRAKPAADDHEIVREGRFGNRILQGFAHAVPALGEGEAYGNDARAPPAANRCCNRP